MSDHCISLVPKISQFPDKDSKFQKVLQWLIAEDVIEQALTDCILSDEGGYAVAKGAEKIVDEPENLPFGLVVKGLEIVKRRTVFHTGQNGIEELICPACKQNLVNEDWDFFGVWQEQDDDNISCPLCNITSDIHAFTFMPGWGFSDLGFTFWNWPAFTDNFIKEFKQKLGCDVNIVYTWI